MVAQQRSLARGAGVVALCALALVGAPALGQDLAQGFPSALAVQLARSKEIYVATQRKDGTRSDAAPVWFAVIDNAIWFATKSSSNKAKRIGRGSPAWVSVNGESGPFVKMKAEVVKDPAMADRLGAIYAKKYWIAWAGMFRPGSAKITDGSNVLVRLTPQ